MRRLAPFLLTVAAAGCASDKKFVADSTAAFLFHEDRYRGECVEVIGPQDCHAFRADLQELERAIKLANDIYKIGALPSEEKKAMKDVRKRVRNHK